MNGDIEFKQIVKDDLKLEYQAQEDDNWHAILFFDRGSVSNEYMEGVNKVEKENLKLGAGANVLRIYENISSSYNDFLINLIPLIHEPEEFISQLEDEILRVK